MSSLKAGYGFVAGLLAHDALLGERNCPCGFGLLVFEEGLGLSKGRLRRSHLGLSVDRCIRRFAARLALATASRPASGE